MDRQRGPSPDGARRAAAGGHATHQAPSGAMDGCSIVRMHPSEFSAGRTLQQRLPVGRLPAGRQSERPTRDTPPLFDGVMRQRKREAVSCAGEANVTQAGQDSSHRVLLLSPQCDVICPQQYSIKCSKMAACRSRAAAALACGRVRCRRLPLRWHAVGFAAAGCRCCWRHAPWHAACVTSACGCTVGDQSHFSWLVKLQAFGYMWMCGEPLQQPP